MKIVSYVTVFILNIFLFAFFFNVMPAAAASGFDAGRIIDDRVMTNSNSMTVTQIQNFLSSKVGTCDTNGSQPASEFGRPDLTRAQYASLRGWAPPPYTCLKNYVTSDGRSSAQAIYDVSKKYTINPQVLIVLLQKEQGLVTDTWPLSTQYKTATGYGCPDTAPCDSAYFGLVNQLDWAAKLFRAVINQSPTWYSPYVVGSNFVYWSPTLSCGGSNVNIQNWSTAALYNYTPYQPNQASLASGYGQGDGCSSYGNRNFYNYFTDWFGSTTTAPTYTWSLVQQNLYLDQERTIALPYNTYAPRGQKLYLELKVSNTGNQTWHKWNTRFATVNPKDRASIFYGSDWLSSNRLPEMVESQVLPGETATFYASFTTPQTPGNYKEYYNLVMENVSWMNDIGLFVPVRVFDPRQVEIYNDPARTQRIDNGSIYKNSTNSIYGRLFVMNTSRSTLSAQTSIITTSPQDRISAFSHNSWLSPSRIKTLGKALAPGEATTIEFELSAPKVSGNYNEKFGLFDQDKNILIESDTLKYNLSVLDQPLDVVNSGASLTTNKSIHSSDQSYRFTLQDDGNLVLYTSSNKPIWASNTVGKGANRLVMQSDGNLVLYTASNSAAWASNTVGKGANRLVMQSDGNLVLYTASNSAVWASNTSGRR